MLFSPAKTLVLFFVSIIAIGTLLLCLPFSLKDGVGFSFMANLFTSVSAVSVTGLTVVSIGQHYSIFGQLVITLLVQLGGWGYMFVTTLSAVLVGKITIKDRRIMHEFFDITSFSEFKNVLEKSIFFVLAIEIVGTIVLSVLFLRHYPLLKSIYLGFIHCIMAFCNAGITPFDNGLTAYYSDPAILFVFTILIILGSIGFFVLVDMYDSYKDKHVHLLTHTKIVLSTTAVFLILGIIYFIIAKQNFINALFQSASLRTSGFNTTDMAALSPLGKIFIAFLMAIGGAPASMSGGLKVTTFIVMLVSIESFIKGREDVCIFKRRLSNTLVRKTALIVVLFVMTLFALTVMMVLVEPHHPPIDLFFETTAAFSNAGVSLGFTQDLSVFGKIIEIVAMFIGRISIATFLLLTIGHIAHIHQPKYPQADVFVG
ncbi:MAG: hypothetical protein LBC07_02400 [Elusimicrobiota bacterium]|jgi:trk system potassium uptake protein TrkH|nr:hypothetical protein [Elusimicrobiota bacterium]